MIRTSRAPLRVAVLAGGESLERAISLASGHNVAAALCLAGHEVTCLDPQALAYVLKMDKVVGFRPVRLCEVDWSRFDACFLTLHGGAGEDGRIQRFLEQRGIPFTGPSAASSRLAMSKLASKNRFRDCGIPTPDSAEFDASTPQEFILDQCHRLQWPVVVKPNAQGSSLGVSLAYSPEELMLRVHDALCFGNRGLIEAFLPGREFTVAMVDREPLPLIEVQGGSIFCYHVKYDSQNVHHEFPIDLSAKTAVTITSAAVAAAEALNTRGLVRVDVRLDAQERPYVLELNAIPGMTESSLAPAAAQHAGIDMPTLCNRLLP